jgi:predicted DNA-binding transcriptional regulator AlpA
MSELLAKEASRLERFLSTSDLRGEPYNIKVSRETLRQWMANGKFPQAYSLQPDNKFAPRAWKESEVLAWARERDAKATLKAAYTPYVRPSRGKGAEAA